MARTKTQNAGAAEERGKIQRKVRQLIRTGGTLEDLAEWIQQRKERLLKLGGLGRR